MKKEDLIVGKWYTTSLWTDDDKPCFCKFSEYKDNYIQHSENINFGVYTIYKTKWLCISSTLNTLVEATPEEYSKYLPDGHPDKIVNDTVGKWFKSNNWSSKNDFCKATGFIGTPSHFIKHIECVHQGEYRKKSSEDTWISKNIVEAKPEEYSKYLPDGHPDKLNDKFLTNIGTIKVGDCVIFSFRDNNKKVIMYVNEIQGGYRYYGSTLIIDHDRTTKTFVSPYEINFTDRTKVEKATKEDADWLGDCISVGYYVQKGDKKIDLLNLELGRYYCITLTNFNAKYIIRGTGSDKVGPNIELHNKRYHVGIGTFSNNDNFTIRLATDKEREWLDACISESRFIELESIQAGTFVPKKQVEESTNTVVSNTESTRIKLFIDKSESSSLIKDEVIRLSINQKPSIQFKLLPPPKVVDNSNKSSRIFCKQTKQIKFHLV